MDEIDLSKQELEQSQEEFRKSFIEYRRTLQEALTKKEQELIVAQTDLRQAQHKLNETIMELEALKEKLRQTETQLFSREKEAAAKKATLRLQGILLSMLFLLSAVLAGFGINLLTSTSSSSLGWIILALGAATFIVAAIITIWITPENKSEKTPRKSTTSSDNALSPSPPTEDVEILRKEIVYEYLPDGQTMYQRKHIKLRALENSVKRYEDRYRWTGNGTCILRSKTPGFEITNQHKGEEEIWDYFDVTFPRTLHKGDTAEFTIEWELFDEQAQAKPFLSALIDSETEYLLLQVILPRELAPTSAYFEEYANFFDKEPVLVERLNWSPATNSLKYEIHNPVKYHQYYIRWYRE